MDRTESEGAEEALEQEDEKREDRLGQPPQSQQKLKGVRALSKLPAPAVGTAARQQWALRPSCIPWYIGSTGRGELVAAKAPFSLASAVSVADVASAERADESHPRQPTERPITERLRAAESADFRPESDDGANQGGSARSTACTDHSSPCEDGRTTGKAVARRLWVV